MFFLLFFFSGSKMIFGLFFPMSKKCNVFVVDTVRSDQLPNLPALYNAERNSRFVE
jgi:DNA polymerase epsilon subunit 1